MKKKLRDNLFRVVLSVLGLGLLFVIAVSLTEQETVAGPQGETGTLEKLIIANGNAVMNINLERLNAADSRSRTSNADIRFELESNAFYTIMVFNGELRAALPSAVGIDAGDSAVSRSVFGTPGDLVIESLPWGGDFEFVVRDRQSDFTYFNIDGPEVEYNSEDRKYRIVSGRLLVSDEYAKQLGRGTPAGTVAGEISMSATMFPIEITTVENGAITSNSLPPTGELAGTVPGPDVVVGDLKGLAQFGSAFGDQVGLAVGTDSCNYGTQGLNWHALPSNDHPVIPQNLYRMSGGPGNDLRFEQIGQSSVKHAFTALQQNLCNLGCVSGNGSLLGSGCSDPYSASLNAGPSLGSRAWINPFNGFFPRSDSATPPNSHGGHSHNGTSHRILTNISDLANNQNAGATYYAEAQYITPHEYAWCQSNPGQCNMYNNVSYRRYNVSGNGSPFSFSAAQSTERMKTAVSAWPGASFVDIHPAPGVDGVGTIAYKVTETSPGVWHYEYAIYNQNLDRAFGSFQVPLGDGVTLSNIGFHAPPQHPGSTADGTFNSQGYSSTPWAANQAAGSITWSTETFAQNQNANAIRWGTMYNFRFDSNTAPQLRNATIGFYKTGEPVVVQIMAPAGAAVSNVTVSGRVTTQSGVGIAKARVTLEDSEGNKRTVQTSTFGYYRVSNVGSGQTYTFSVAAKGRTFSPQVVPVNDHINGLNFVSTN